MKGATFALAALLVLSVFIDVQAQSSGKAQITEIRHGTLKIYKIADTKSLIEEVQKSDVATELPWDILDYSDNGMYQVEIDGQMKRLRKPAHCLQAFVPQDDRTKRHPLRG